MGIVQESVEDRIGMSGLADYLVSMLHGQLAGDDGAAAPVPILQDVQEFAALRRNELGQPPVVRLC